MAHSSQGAPGAPRLGNYVKMMGMQDDSDPVAIAKNIILDTNVLLTKQPTLRQSSATIQRAKIINTYIEKIHGDIRMLTSVKEQLAAVKEQLVKEKTDTLIAERISKEALGAYQAILDKELLANYLDEDSALEKKPAGAAATASPEVKTVAVPTVDEETRKAVANQIVNELKNVQSTTPVAPLTVVTGSPSAQVTLAQGQRNPILPVARPNVFQVQENLTRRRFPEEQDMTFMANIVRGLDAPDVIPVDSDEEDDGIALANNTGLSLSLDENSDTNSNY